MREGKKRTQVGEYGTLPIFLKVKRAQAT